MHNSLRGQPGPVPALGAQAPPSASNPLFLRPRLICHGDPSAPAGPGVSREALVAMVISARRLAGLFAMSPAPDVRDLLEAHRFRVVLVAMVIASGGGAGSGGPYD